MALQVSMAFSKNFVGSAIIAGGPYLCSNGIVMDALTSCMV